MITWFSTGVRPRVRARSGTRIGALALGLVMLAVPARGDEPAPLTAKVHEKQELAAARLAAARTAAGAGRVADARALYGQALAAGLAAEGQALADLEAPRPTSVTSGANEQPSEEAAAAPAAVEPAPAPVVEAGPTEEVTPAREAAAREAAAREAAAREAARPQPAPVVVVAAPVAPPSSSWAPTFAVGVRTALQAKDPTGGEHVSAGLVFTWLTFASRLGRGAIVVDLESTRWQAGRSDRMDRAQVAFYGLGFDWTVPFASHGTGVFVGAEAAAGVLQGSTMTAPAVSTDGVLQIMPHLGGALSYRGVGLFVDAGWRFQLLTASGSGQASEGGAVLQGGLRVEMPAGVARDAGGFQLGYATRVTSPNGSRVYGRYGGLGGGGSGPLLEHELLFMTNAYLPRHADMGLAFTYLGADQEGGGSTLRRVGLGWVGTWHAFATRQLFNPYAGFRVGLAYMSSGDVSTFQYAKQIDAIASGTAGLDVAVLRRLTLRLGVAYDGVAYANDRANASLSGYAVEAGLLVRL